MLVLGALGGSLAGADTESLELSVGELSASARRHHAPQRATASDDHPSKAHWLLSPGVGAAFDPNGFLLSAQIEYIDRPYLFYGPFADLIFVSGGTAFTGGVTVRTLLGGGRLRPSIEAGMGLTFASGGTGSFGFHFHFGIGADYRLAPGISLGTMLKPSFNPPIDNFWVAWPMVIGRFAL